MGAPAAALAVREALQVRLAELGIDHVLDVCPTGLVLGLETLAAEQLLRVLTKPEPRSGEGEE